MASPHLEGSQGQQNPKHSLSKKPDPVVDGGSSAVGVSNRWDLSSYPFFPLLQVRVWLVDAALVLLGLLLLPKLSHAESGSLLALAVLIPGSDTSQTPPQTHLLLLESCFCRVCTQIFQLFLSQRCCVAAARGSACLSTVRPGQKEVSARPGIRSCLGWARSRARGLCRT